MNQHTRRTTIHALALVAVCLGTLLAAGKLGPLNPPSGSVSSTNKTLTEIEPRIAINATNTPGDNDATPSLFKITAPGSYYLTGNVTGVAGKSGIEIASANVTVDLNGFTLIGVTGASNGIVLTGANVRGTVVRNGTVASWPGPGVNISQSSNAGRILDVVAHGNGAGFIGGNSCIISGCIATNNSGNGFAGSNGCMVSNCISRENTGNGFSFFLATSIANCSAQSNAQSGIAVDTGSTIANSSASQNALFGFVGISSLITNCNAEGNSRDGIFVTNKSTVLGNNCIGTATSSDAGIRVAGVDNRIEGNNCTGATRGIAVDSSGNVIIRNTCSGNTTNWVIAANNVVGPILDRTAPASAAISGNSAPDSTGSTHPNANFSY
jgi:parallel beta-helix repeat protein